MPVLVRHPGTRQRLEHCAPVIPPKPFGAVLDHHLQELGGPVVLVNQATPRIKRLYRALGYELRLLDAPRRINCTGDRTPAKEVLALRNV